MLSSSLPILLLMLSFLPSSSFPRSLSLLLRPLSSSSQLPSLPYTIGITGPIASGKTTFSTSLSNQKNYTLLQADSLITYPPNSTSYDLIVSEFGPQIVGSDSLIDRKILGDIVFSSPPKMKILESILWPEASLKISTFLKATSNNVVLLEASPLHSAGWDIQFCDEVISVTAKESVRVGRLMARNGLTEEAARRRVEGQRGKIREGGTVIVNEGEGMEEEVEREGRRIDGIIKKILEDMD
ncbi:hypothetical protein TrVE_jg12558 [Triparma verrucosa]|uniref:Dephospho-CoA kinase n=1 Tax=Triparma verrucosa TaxID=1606542 RepID=A0A9W7B5S5_9STRA|nr:hypothetical protein TrVE_jg12558 [Triparma verrucosa]